VARFLDEADCFARLDWCYYDSSSGVHLNLNSLRPDITAGSPLTNRLIYFELKRLGQGWSYGVLQQALNKLVNLGKINWNEAKGLFAVQFTERQESIEGFRVELSNLKKRYFDFEICGPEMF